MVTDTPKSSSYIREPLKYSGSLDNLSHFEVTTIIGREYPTVQLADILQAENADDMLRDLAITISERGVVFFRNQDISLEQQKYLTQRLGQLSGKPASSKLHIHPMYNWPDTATLNDEGDKDPEVYVVGDVTTRIRGKNVVQNISYTPASHDWHTDALFENIPSDYACLRMITPSVSGGDTLWASGYEMFDRISPSYREYLSTLSSTFALPGFNDAVDEEGIKIVSPRGSPENSGENFTTVHPVVRTNPVTGWKSVYGFGSHIKQINDVAPYESKCITDYFRYLITQNHDLQLRFKWGRNDVAIWDNRCVFHSATFDNAGQRMGYRTMSIGEKPYLDPASVSRREGLAMKA